MTSVQADQAFWAITDSAGQRRMRLSESSKPPPSEGVPGMTAAVFARSAFVAYDMTRCGVQSYILFTYPDATLHAGLLGS